jgi:hypothetical protein
MAWARLDDGFHSHPKVNELLGEADGWAALGFWAACLSWATQHTRSPGKVPGFVPSSTVNRFDRAVGPAYAALLVKYGLWETADGGWLIHDFHIYAYLPSDAVREQRRKAANVRWEKERVTASETPGGYNDASMHDSDAQMHDSDANSMRGTGLGIGSRRGAGSRPVPLKSSSANQTTMRNDVDRLCNHLADAVAGNGSRRPAVTQRWREAARLMIDKDGRTEEQITRAIDWCQADEFWRANILSMPKLRQQYDRLRLAAMRVNGHSADDRVRKTLALAEQYRQEERDGAQQA